MYILSSRGKKSYLIADARISERGAAFCDAHTMFAAERSGVFRIANRCLLRAMKAKPSRQAVASRNRNDITQVYSV